MSFPIPGRSRSRRHCLAAVLWVLIVLPATGATLLTVLDDFEEGSQDLQTDQEETLTDAYTSSQPGSTIMGGVREIVFEVTDNPRERNARVRVQPGPGRLFTRLRTGTTASVTVRYNRGGTGLGGIDLRAGGANGFGFEFQDANAGLGITVAVTDTSGRTATGAFTQAAANPVDPVTLVFDDFSNPAGADFSAADSIEFRFDPAVAGDFRMTGTGLYFVPVPEPTTAVLTVAALGVLLGHRRRREKQG